MSARARTRRHDVFISYASHDRAQATAIVEELERSGVRCWIAPRDVVPGVPYAKALVAAIESSRALVIAFSRAANDSDAVQSELEIAFNRSIPILPVRLEPVEPDGSAEYYLRRRQWFDMDGDFERHLPKLCASVREMIAPRRPVRRTRPRQHGIETRTILVDREAEMAEITGLIAAAEHGEGGIVVVGGEPGIGKSSLLEATFARAVDARFCAVRTANFEHARTPLGPWIDLLREISVFVPQSVPLEERARAAYRRMLGLEDAHQDSPMPDRRRLFVIVMEALERAARYAPLLLVIDDVQWADPETIELLDFVAPRLARSRVLIAIAHRQPNLEPSAAAISALERYQNVRVIALAGLSSGGVRQIVNSMFDAKASLSNATIDEIARRSDGHPLFAAELARDALSGRGSGARLPQSMKISATARFRLLDPDVARIVEIASVVGRRFELEDLIAIAERDRAETVRALRLARDAGLIEESPGDAFSFRHELVRAAIYEELLSAERSTIHATSAQRLASREDVPADVLAYHWTRAGNPQEAYRYAQRSAEEAVLMNAPGSARIAFEQALETRCASPSEDRLIHEELGKACNTLGDARAAAEHFALVAASYRAENDSTRAAYFDLRFAANAYRAGQSDDFLVAATRVLNETVDPTLLFGAHAILASFHANRGAFDEALAHVAAADAFDVEGNLRDRLSLEWARAVIYDDTDATQAMDAARRAVGLAQERGTPDLFALNLMNFGIVATSHGYDEEADDALDRAIVLADQNGATYTSGYARCIRARSFYNRGQLAAARTIVVEALLLNIDALVVRALLAAIGLEVMADLGVLESFRRLQNTEILENAFAAGEPGRFAPLAAAHVHAHRMLGEREEAATLIKRALRAIDRFDVAPNALVTFARYGDADDLAAIRVLLPDRVESKPLTFALGLIRAIVASRLRAADAAERLNAAMDATRDTHPLIEAYLLELHGDRRRALALYKRLSAQGHLRRLALPGVAVR
jgi:tetratricopeptide (TPR) repeat protein